MVVVRNIAYLYVIQLLRLCLPLALLSILTKTLTSAQYSVYIYTLSSAAFLSIFVEYGFNVSATRRITTSVDKESIREIILQTQAARWILTWITVLFFLWVFFISNVFSNNYDWALTAWLLGVMTGLTPTYYYQAISQLRIVAVLEVFSGSVIFIVVFLFVEEANDFSILSITMIISRFFIWQILERRMCKKYELTIQSFFCVREGMHALKDGWKIFLVQASASLYTTFNVILLGGVSSSYAVAVYGSCDRVIRAGLSFVTQATSAIFPHLNALKMQDVKKLRKAQKISLSVFALGSILCFPIIWFLAPVISNQLFHGTLPDAVKVLRVMALVVPAIAVGNVLAFHFLVVNNQESLLNRTIFSAVPISFLISYWLASAHGAFGMAVAWVTVEWFVTMTLAIIVYFRHHQRSK